MTELHNTPNMELAKDVVETLISEGLIISENQEKVLQKMYDGRMTANEWKSYVEMKVLKDEGKVNNGKSDQKD